MTAKAVKAKHPIKTEGARPHNWLDDARKRKEKEAKVAGKAKNANSGA